MGSNRSRSVRRRGLILIAALLTSTVMLSFTAITAAGGRFPFLDDYERIGYFAGWNMENYQYLLRDVHENGQAEAMTTLMWAFGDVNSEGLCDLEDGQAWRLYQRRYSEEESVSGEADEYSQPLAGGLNQLRQLREEHQDLRAAISLGGWNLSRYFSVAAATEESREAFAESCVDLWLRGDLPESENEPQGGEGTAEGVFDGIDLDWEWPAGGGHSQNVTSDDDRRNYTLLVQELRREMDAYSEESGREVFLSASLPSQRDLMEGGLEPEVFEYLDIAQIQGFDMTGGWSDIAAPHSPLYTPSDAPDGANENSVDAAVQRYLDHGARAEQLVIGFPAFGRGWEGAGSQDDGLYQEAEAPAEGTYGEQTHSFDTLQDQPGERYFDPEIGAAWIYDGDEWWGYDSPESVRLKGEYVQEHRLRGLMQWNLDQDADGELFQALDESLD